MPPFSGLATFITIVGGRFWSIIAFSTHQNTVNQSAKRGSSSSTPSALPEWLESGTAWSVFRLAWSWKKNAIMNGCECSHSSYHLFYTFLDSLQQVSCQLRSLLQTTVRVKLNIPKIIVATGYGPNQQTLTNRRLKVECKVCC